MQTKLIVFFKNKTRESHFNFLLGVTTGKTCPLKCQLYFICFPDKVPNCACLIYMMLLLFGRQYSLESSLISSLLRCYMVPFYLSELQIFFLSFFFYFLISYFLLCGSSLTSDKCVSFLHHLI